MSTSRSGYQLPGAGGETRLSAPAASISPSTPRVICPGEGTRFPKLDSRLVTPETREEMVGGVRLSTLPAETPHGDSHFDFSAVLETLLQPGYVGSIDMLTRYEEGEDFAADITIRRGGISPDTAERYLEELAFEIGNAQRRAELVGKARNMTRRGVRRIFAMMIREQSVYEWDAEREELLPFAQDAVRDEATLLAPLPLSLLRLIARGAAGRASVLEVQRAVKDFMAEALDAQGNPVMQRIRSDSRQQGHQQGQRQGVAQSVLTALAVQGVPVDDLSRRRILACEDLATLQRWLVQAMRATAIGDLFTH